MNEGHERHAVRRHVAALASVAAILGVVLSAGPAQARAEAIHGTWQTMVPVVMTGYEPSPSTPTTGTYNGIGSTLWQGALSGVTEYTIGGTVDLITGAGKGKLEETFVGRSSDGASGTIGFTETYTVDDASHIVIKARIVKGTGDFLGARGWVIFDGTLVSVVTGSGTYHGRWTRPAQDPPADGP